MRVRKIERTGIELDEKSAVRLKVPTRVGSGETFEGRLGEVRRLVMAALPRRGVPPLDAEDVTQVALAILNRRRSSIESAPSVMLAAYATKIAVRLWRRSAKRMRGASATFRESAVHRNPVTPCPEAQVIAREIVALWVVFAATLPCDVRELVVACELDLMSRAEASKRFGIPIGTVHSRVARTRREFERWLEVSTGPRRRA